MFPDSVVRGVTYSDGSGRLHLLMWKLSEFQACMVLSLLFMGSGLLV
jgi:hypothetical protein